jgi:hypothetical protein
LSGRRNIALACVLIVALQGVSLFMLYSAVAWVGGFTRNAGLATSGSDPFKDIATTGVVWLFVIAGHALVTLVLAYAASTKRWCEFSGNTPWGAAPGRY